MPLPTFAIPKDAGLLRAYMGCAKLLAATAQWQRETGRDEIGATERIFFPELPVEDLTEIGLPENSLPVPVAIISRPVAMPYYRGHGPADSQGRVNTDHYYGSLMLNLVLPESAAYADSHVDRWADIIARMEICIQQMRALKNNPPTPAHDPAFNTWNFDNFAIFHRGDNDTGEPSEVGQREEGQAWDLRDWNGDPLGRRAFTSSWILDFGY